MVAHEKALGIEKNVPPHCEENEELLFVLDALDFTDVDWGSSNDNADNQEEITKQQQSCCPDALKGQQLCLKESLERLLSLTHPARSFLLHDDKDKDQTLQHLFAWATAAHGAWLDGICADKDSYGGRGLFASRQVTKPKTVLAVLPRSLRVGQPLACRRIPGLPNNTPDLTATSLLVLSFLADAYVDSNNNDNGSTTTSSSSSSYDVNHWGWYAKSLPMLPTEFTNAITMTQEQINAWQKKDDESYYKEIRKVRTTADCCVQYIQSVLLAQETQQQPQEEKDDAIIVLPQHSAVYWAIAMVMSRAHAFGSKTGGRWLTPVLDLANHSPNANCELEGDDQGRLLLKAKRPLERGEQITIDYQVYDDAKLFATYGFSLS